MTDTNPIEDADTEIGEPWDYVATIPAELVSRWMTWVRPLCRWVTPVQTAAATPPDEREWRFRAAPELPGRYVDVFVLTGLPIHGYRHLLIIIDREPQQ